MIDKQIKSIIENNLDELYSLMYLVFSMQFGESRKIESDYKKGSSNKALSNKVSFNNTKKLRVASGKLLNSFFDKRDIKLRGNVVSGVIGSKLPYANIHEHGGDIKTTKRMAGFFYYRFKETGDVNWLKLFVIAKTRPVIKIKSRPYFKHFISDMNNEYLEKWWYSLERDINKYLNTNITI
jgi:phage gpG-like protein